MPSSFVFQRLLALGRYSRPSILTGNQQAAPSPFSRPILWLIRLSRRYALDWGGSRLGSAFSSEVIGLRVLSGNSTWSYFPVPSPPSVFTRYNCLYFASSLLLAALSVKKLTR